MVHGGTQGSKAGADQQFAAQKPLADSGWQLVIPDRPGHGRSPDPGRPDDADADGLWVADLLEDGAHLVGHSFGGCVALAAAAERPAAVRSLTLIEPGMQALAISDPRVKKLVFRIVTTLMLSWSAVSRAQRMIKLLGIPPEVSGRFSRDDLQRIGKSIRRAKLPAKAALEQQLGVVRSAGMPLLLVTGGWSPGFEATADKVASVGGGRRLVIDAGNHFPHLVGGPFNEALAIFMTESDRARPHRNS
jgi:pimeloyl-ACP methyl ester carboxylesterase